MTSTSYSDFKEAKKYMPGGVNSPARDYSMVGDYPPFIERGKGAYIYDAEGNKYIDFVCSWGALLFGHSPRWLVEALKKQVEAGTSYGAPTRQETELARLICDFFPSIEMLRLVNSGTEATMSALRLARGYTDRNMILKFKGCYHGHFDSLLVEAGSGPASLGKPSSAGVPEPLAALTLTAPYGDVKAVEKIFERHGKNLAAVIVEPAAGNMGLIVPPDNFLTQLRKLTEDAGTVLIFDEVMTGFRAAAGGIQELTGIKPDLTTLGKITGGGLPLAVFGGKKKIMQHLAPEGDVYQAGTLSGNPLAVRAGIETLRMIKENNPYPRLEKTREHLRNIFEKSARNANIPLCFHGLGGMFSFFFTTKEVIDFATASSCDQNLFQKFHRLALREGLYFPPSFYESSFLNTCMRGEILEETTEKLVRVFNKI